MVIHLGDLFFVWIVDGDVRIAWKILFHTNVEFCE
jgi:hypothetical protein